ncbi:MAG TPA: hypothetical protein VHK01_04100 [Lacipirellulaceae bacterium]|nr:hypothetical protein [Lacipirellulaceae bacterium]
MNRVRVFTAIVAIGLLEHVGARSAAAQSLDGTWEISAVIDNGRVVEPTDVLLNYAADGRVIIRGQTVELVVPMTYQRKRLPFVVDNTKSPMNVDLAGTEKTGGRGIFLASKDSLVLCLSSRDRGRPTSFASLPGSGNLLVTLKRISAGDSSSPAPSPPTAPSYEDEQLRRMLIGTWGHQDADSIHYITLNGDGSVSSTMTWKDRFKQMFHQDVRSSGTWKVLDGVVIVNITTSTDKERRGQVGSFRVRSINGSELVAVDHNGQVRQEWKAPRGDWAAGGGEAPAR